MLICSCSQTFIRSWIYLPKWDQHKVRIGILRWSDSRTVMACKTANIGPFGLVGTATALHGAKLIAVVINFFLGAL